MAKLRFDIEALDAKFREEVAAKKLIRNSDEWNLVYGEYDNDRDLLQSEIDEIETANSIRRAKAWGVPIPPRPIWSEEPVYDDNYWDWSRVHGKYYLNAEGKALLRREAYAEMEMFYKPWLTWAALAISIISLVFSILKR